VIIGVHDNQMNESKADIESVTAWRNGRFIFKKKRVEDIMYDLARWYDVKIFFSNSAVKDVSMTLDVPRYGRIEDILSLMEGTRDLSFDISGHVISVN
jgi:ferric-dicitrate binding protein FerR (iron transport regulator)